MTPWLRRIVGTLVVALAVVLLWRGLLIFVGVVALVGVATYVCDRWRKWHAVRRFRAAWRRQGKDALLVYSNSPHWQRYVEENWLPRWGDRAVVLNWSERMGWKRRAPAEVALFRAFAGAREFNPLGIVVPAAGQRVHIVRFWRAFLEHKHGRGALLQDTEAEFDACLTATPAPNMPLQPTSGRRPVIH